MSPDTSAPLNRKRVAAWALYDFANSTYPAVIVATIFSVYYGNDIVPGEGGKGDFWWSLVVSTSALIVALSSPLLGSIADRAGVRKKMMVLFAYVCIISVALFATLEPGMILFGFFLGVMANIGFEGSLVYYNAYLPEIAPPEKQGSVSGLGFGVGYLGSIAGLLIALPLVTAKPPQYDLVWFSVAGFFALFSLPTFFMLPRDRPGDRTVLQAARDGIVGFKKILGHVWREREVRRFLLAYFFYIDGVLTTIYFSSRFAKNTLHFEDKELMHLFLTVQASALVGALALAKPTDRWGAKRVISLTLVLWTVVVIAAFFVELKTTFFYISVLAGIGLGSVQAASRSLMSNLIPKGKETEMFGFYAFCGKSSSVVGPLIFGQVSLWSGGNQRLSVLTVGILFLVGLILLQRVRDPIVDR